MAAKKTLSDRFVAHQRALVTEALREASDPNVTLPWIDRILKTVERTHPMLNEICNIQRNKRAR